MRALYLVLLITLCLPLQAGDPAELARAVEMFRSPHPGVRAQGSQIANIELRRLLGPFIKAMQDPDPEVRRSVREAILKLVPFHDREPETPKARTKRLQLAQFNALAAWQVQFKRGRAVRIPRVQVQPFQQKNLLEAINRQLVLQNKNLQKAARVLGKFGVTGSFIQVGNWGRGLRVSRVMKKSPAETAGLLKGDTILSVNGKAFANYEVFLKALDPRRGWTGAKLKVMRGARIFDLTLK